MDMRHSFVAATAVAVLPLAVAAQQRPAVYTPGSLNRDQQIAREISTRRIPSSPAGTSPRPR
jgi:hypothetical protein